MAEALNLAAVAVVVAGAAWWLYRKFSAGRGCANCAGAAPVAGACRHQQVAKSVAELRLGRNKPGEPSA